MTFKPGIGTFGPRSVALATRTGIAGLSPEEIKKRQLQILSESILPIPKFGQPRIGVPITGGEGMGFLDTLFNIAAPIISTVVPGGSIITAAARGFGLGGQVGPQAPAGPPAVIQPRVTGVATSPLGVARSRAGAIGAELVPAGGNGQVSVMTIVQTINNVTGQVVREKTLRGSPFLMNSDIAVAKRVFRTASKLGQRLPKKMVRQSEASKLKDEIQDAAFRAVRNGGHHGGHHLPLACPS